MLRLSEGRWIASHAVRRRLRVASQWIRAPLVDRRYESDDNVSVKSANTSMSASRLDLRYRPLALAPRTTGGIRQAYLQRLGLLREAEGD